MRIKTAELLSPTAEGFQTLVRMAYAAGRARGRQEATRELHRRADLPATFTTRLDDLNDMLGRSLGEAPHPETKLS